MRFHTLKCHKLVFSGFLVKTQVIQQWLMLSNRFEDGTKNKSKSFKTSLGNGFQNNTASEMKCFFAFEMLSFLIKLNNEKAGYDFGKHSDSTICFAPLMLSTWLPKLKILTTQKQHYME